MNIKIPKEEGVIFHGINLDELPNWCSNERWKMIIDDLLMGEPKPIKESKWIEFQDRFYKYRVAIKKRRH